MIVNPRTSSTDAAETIANNLPRTKHNGNAIAVVTAITTSLIQSTGIKGATKSPTITRYAIIAPRLIKIMPIATAHFPLRPKQSSPIASYLL